MFKKQFSFGFVLAYSYFCKKENGREDIATGDERLHAGFV